MRTSAIVLFACALGLLGLVFAQRHRQLSVAAASAQERIASLEHALSVERSARSLAEAKAARAASTLASAAAAAVPELTPAPSSSPSNEVAACHCEEEQRLRRPRDQIEPPPPPPPLLVSPPPAAAPTLPPRVQIIFSDAVPLETVRAAARTEMREAILRASHAASAAEAAAAAEGVTSRGGSDSGSIGEQELEAARFMLREALAEENPGWCHCPPPPNITRLCAAVSSPTIGTCDLRVASVRAEADSLRSALLEANSRAQDAQERAAEATLLGTK